VPRAAPSAPAERADRADGGKAVAPVTAAPPRLAIPVEGVAARELKDTFTDRRGKDRPHDAIDIMAPAGTPVRAAGPGKVVKLFTSERGGITVYQFEPGETFGYYYAHLQRYAPGLKEGQVLARGDLVGYVGSTGNASPGAPHLHFAVYELGPEKRWWEGRPINPYPLFEGVEKMEVGRGE
jgi:murein DD-endopeptidase MepM/ murein hydrolase activator NlpD